MVSLYRGAAPPSDLPALFTGMILDASSKRSCQLEAQQEQEHEVGEPSRRAGSLLGRPPTSCSCSCCALSWQLRFELASRIMPVNSAGRSLGGAAPLYRLTIRRPCHVTPPSRGSARADWDPCRARRPRGAAARPVHFQCDTTWSLTISQKLHIRSSRNFERGTVSWKRRKKSDVAY